MLRFFRSSGIGQGVMAGIVVLIIAVFALEFRTGSGSPTSALKEQCAIDYARHCVESKDYYAAVGLIAERVTAKGSRDMSLRKKILMGLAERELLYEAAKDLDLGISDDAIEKEIMAGRAYVSLPVEEAEMLAGRVGLCRLNPGGMGCEPGTAIGVRQLHVRATPSGPFDYGLYQKAIRIVTNRGPKEFRATQERELVAERLRELVRSRARVSEAEAFAIYERGRTRAVVRSVTLEKSWFGKFAVDLGDATVDAWAKEHATEVDDSWKTQKDEFVPDCPLVSEIVVPLPEGALDSEKEPARERAVALRERVKKGESFESVAREASSSPSAAFGGRVGCPTSSYGADAEAIRTAAKKLERGAPSDPIETPHAFVVLRLDGTLDKANAERDGRHQVTRLLYLKFAQDEAMRAFANDLVGKVKAGAKLEDVVKAATDAVARRGFSAKPGEKDPGSPPALLAADKPKFEVSSPFNASGNPLPDVEPREPLAARAFELDKADAIDEKPVETATGLVILQLKEKIPATREEFDKEKWELYAQLNQAKGHDALVRYVAELKRAAGEKLKIHEQPFAEEPKASNDE
ncbi:MAG TPA: peptidylprolyl isomerase [Polyangiaceae bacterium]